MLDADRSYRLVERRGPAGRLVLCAHGNVDCRIIVFSEFAGPDLPALVTNPVLEPGPTGRWLLRCREGSFEFLARDVQRIDGCPSLYEPLHRQFALTLTDRLAVRVLLGILRLPGGARLLRLWHSHRR